MKKTKHIMAFSCLLCIFVGAFILSFTSPSMAATFCVDGGVRLLFDYDVAISNIYNNIIWNNSETIISPIL